MASQVPTPATPAPGVQATATPATNAAALYIGDLHPETLESDVFQIFNEIGPVVSIRICRDSVSRKSLGYGYINYQIVTDAERALNVLNYTAIKGKPCRLMWATSDPSARKNMSSNIFIKNLDKSIDNKSLYDTFSLFGNILSCKVATDDMGRSKGYGFVQYQKDEDAEDAIKRVNGMQIGEKQVYVGKFQNRSEREAVAPVFTGNLYVKHFPASWTEDDLRGMFEKYGIVTSLVMMNDPMQRKFGFVNFESPDVALKVIEECHGMDMREDKSGPEPEALPGDELPAHRLYVQKAQTKKERHAMLTGQLNASTSVSLYVKNLDETIGDDELRALFDKFGALTSAKVMHDPTGKSRGFGFVGFERSEDATKAVAEMHLKHVEKKPLYVGLAEKKEERNNRLQAKFNQMNNGYGTRPNVPYYHGGRMPNMPMYRPGGQGGYPPMRPVYMQNMMMRPMNRMMNFTATARNANMANYGQQGPVPQPASAKSAEPMSFDPSAPLTAASLAAAPPGMQKQMLGEKLYPTIAKWRPEMAGKITGMMLEMDNSEILMLLESETQMKAKIDEAMRVLEKQA